MVSLAQSPVGPFEQQIGDSPPRIPPVYTPPDRRRRRGGRDGWQVRAQSIPRVPEAAQGTLAHAPGKVRQGRVRSQDE
ncbi:hypothetical protein BC936DRAFT_138090 [Jimgerdemannia flammicorona]|uniref:Uncharacterized protein n=1 Tax=Jimgerdemannia flammicorona TaxID=994334 RepID=A0A433CVX7_9FUNG|nr:hypothetical protein BC936DRAFT_138090 [Jimgerdemannia flammicorona]